MAKAKPQGRKPHKAPTSRPGNQTQSNQGTGQDNRKTPKASNPPATGQNWGGHLNQEPPGGGQGTGQKY